MPIKIHKHCRITPSPEDGSRLLVMRFWSRGVAKAAFDEWLRDLAPSPDLLRWCLSNRGQIDPDLYDQTWKPRYQAQMSAQRHLTQTLYDRHLSGETLTLLCACHDPQHCHRTVLAELILEQGDS